MLPRVLEAEAMDTPAEASDYDAMDHRATNDRFVADFLAEHGRCRGGTILDVGTGPGRIPIALCRADPGARVLGVDLADAMLALARRNVLGEGFGDRIRFEPADAKGLPLAAGSFEAVISNTILHHIPDPSPALAEMARLVSPGGTVFVRDLARPETEADLARLVGLYAGSESPPARALFEASLRAALTLEEVSDRLKALGLPGAGLAMTSDRHWTWTWRRPASIPG